MIARSAGSCGGGALKATGLEVQLIDEQINNADQVIIVDPVVETLREKRRLTSVSALNVTSHACSRAAPESIAWLAFSHSLRPLRRQIFVQGQRLFQRKSRPFTLIASRCRSRI